MDDLERLTHRVAELESRLCSAEATVETLCRRTGLTGHAAPVPPRLPKPRIIPPPVQPVAVVTPIEETPAFPVIVPETEEEAVSRPMEVDDGPVLSNEPRPSLEARIGKNFAGWIGAIVLVIGVGFFLKYAWQHEWINPSPAARVVFAVLAGVGLAGVGEYLLRKPMRGLAAVLYAAGVAVTMTAFFASSAYFSPPVLDPTAAAAMVLATAAGGVGLALRANLPAMAILSLLGAYLSPIILRPAIEQSGMLIGYLLLLAATGWSLCLIRPQWMVLRTFTFAAGFVWYVNWYLHVGRPQGETSLAFAYLAITYAGLLGELFVTIQRQFKDAPHARVPLGTELGRLEGGIAVLSLLSTFLTCIAMYVLYRTNQPLAGSLAVGLAGVQGVVVLATFSRQLRYSALLQAIALTTLAVPLLLNQFAINIAWLVMAVALAVMNRRLELRWARTWATVLWLLAVGKLITLDLLSPGLRATALTIGTQPVTRWLLMAWSGAIAGHALAFLGRRGASTDRLGVILAALGTILFLGTTAFAWGGGPVLTLAGLVWLTVIIGLRQQGGRIGYASHSWALLLFLAGKWMLLDGLLPMVAHWRGGGAMPVVNMACSDAILLGGLFTWLRGLTIRPIARMFATIAVCTIGFALANFETSRLINHLGDAWTVQQVVMVKQLALCALWAGASLIVATVTRRLEWRFARGVAVALLIAALGRVTMFAADPAMREALVHIGSHAVSRWMLFMVAMAMAAHALGWLVADRTENRDPSASALAGLGTLTFMAAVIGTWGYAPVTTLAGIVWLAPIALLGYRGRRVNYSYHAWALAVALTCKWLLADGVTAAVLAYANPAANPYLPLLNTPALCAALLAAAFQCLGRTTGEQPHWDGGLPARVLAAAVVAGIGFFLLNFEVLRLVNHFATDHSLAEMQIAKQVSLSILWSLTGLAAITAGFSRHVSLARYAGLGLLGVTLLKVLTFDMAGVETIWRILSFTAVGGLLLCVSFIYYKHMEGKAAALEGSA